MKLSSSCALVTGASGSLGWSLARALACDNDVIATYCAHPCVPAHTTAVRLDLRDPGALESLLGEYRPDVMFHAAALADVDRCEREPQTAQDVNVEATRRLAQWAGAAGAKLVFVSTDLVFDGAKGDYSEEDEPGPLSLYGRTKLLAEKAVLDACPQAAVIRGSLFYGMGSPAGRTFLSDLVETLSRHSRMPLFVDQKRNPVLLDDIASAIIEAAGLDLAGLFHVAGGEVVTRYEFGALVCEVFGFDPTLLVPVKMRDFDYVAPRPLNSSLNITKFRKATGFGPTPLKTALADLKERACAW